MTETKGTDINDLLRREKWDDARSQLERQRETDPNNHWLLTQIGVTFYEQKQYEDALKYFRASLKIKSDCPLTLWNLAGTLDALGKPAPAISIYVWLLQNNTLPEKDPCWESKSWTDALKSDCVYRIGVCFQHLSKKQKAENCFRQYLNQLSIGKGELYTIDDVKHQLQRLHSTSKPGGTEHEFRKVVKATLQISGIEPSKARRRTPPIIDLPEAIAR